MVDDFFGFVGCVYIRGVDDVHVSVECFVYDVLVVGVVGVVLGAEYYRVEV